MSPVIPDDPELSHATFRAMGYCGAWDKTDRLWCTRSPDHDGAHAHRYEKTHPLDAVGVQWT
ncbi:hypothetical protein ACIPPM_22210 [Streptomyces sp. NPDC090119]|uniref:hypothetical protein n=1 Tax=Streptomyces sp. NPDC090119 TaxID=3365951 RepID=UPI00382808FA